MDALAESGMHLVHVVSTRFSLGVENGQAGAGWDGQTCLARPNSQARRKGTAGENSFLLFS